MSNVTPLITSSTPPRFLFTTHTGYEPGTPEHEACAAYLRSVDDDSCEALRDLGRQCALAGRPLTYGIRWACGGHAWQLFFEGFREYENFNRERRKPNR